MSDSSPTPLQKSIFERLPVGLKRLLIILWGWISKEILKKIEALGVGGIGAYLSRGLLPKELFLKGLVFVGLWSIYGMNLILTKTKAGKRGWAILVCLLAFLLFMVLFYCANWLTKEPWVPSEIADFI